MWLLPLLVLGVIALAARSSRGAAPPARQLAAGPSPPPVISAGSMPRAPGPIAVLGEILRSGQKPPQKVILCAIAEAQAMGRNDLASDIVQAFVVPAVNANALRYGAPMPPPPPPPPRAQDHQRGTCAPVGSPRAQADSGTCAPVAPPWAQVDPRGACAPPAPPQAPPSPPQVPPQAPGMRPPAPPQITTRYATQDEILAMLHADPTAFLKVMETGRPPLIEVPSSPVAVPPPPQSAAQSAAPMEAPPAPVPAPLAPPPPPPSASSSSIPADAPLDQASIKALIVDQVSAQLSQLPGLAGAGFTLDPSTGAEVFEVRWLSGYPIPTLPPQVGDWPVRVVMVAALPAQQTGLPPEAVAQMQEAAGLHEAADQTRALAPGSPIQGVPDDAWREFVRRLERETPQFASSRHVGQYRQRRERLAELGIDPRVIHGSAVAQRAALDADLANAHYHAANGGVLTDHLRRGIAVPGLAGNATVTLSGVLAVIQCAGLDNAVSWLESPNDRKRYPHTTQMFREANGVF